MRFTERTVGEAILIISIIIMMPVMIVLAVVERGRKHSARTLHALADLMEP